MKHIFILSIFSIYILGLQSQIQEGTWTSCQAQMLDQINVLSLEANTVCEIEECSSTFLEIKKDSIGFNFMLKIESKYCDEPSPPYTLRSESSFSYNCELSLEGKRKILIIVDYNNKIHKFEFITKSEDEISLIRI